VKEKGEPEGVKGKNRRKGLIVTCSWLLHWRIT